MTSATLLMKQADQERTMENVNRPLKKIKIYSLLTGILSFIILIFCVRIVNLNIVKEEKLSASFTAETTVNRIKSQINRYLVVSEFFRNMIQEGHELDDEEFTFLS